MSRKLITSLSLILIVVLVSFLFLFIRTQDTIYRAEDEAIALVDYDYPVQTVNHFYWSTIDATYFALDFIDKEGTHRYALIAQEGGDVTYFTEGDIISLEDAKAIVMNDMSPHKISQMRLSMIEDRPVWEATIKNDNGTITYYTIDARDGSWIETIENI